MAEKEKETEKKIAASSYLLQFAKDIQNLTAAQSSYGNAIIEIYYLNGGKTEGIEALQPAQKQQFIEITQNLRHFINQVYIKYRSIMKTANQEADIEEQIEELHTELTKKESFIPEVQKTLDYCIVMNEVLLKDVIKDLLQTSQELMDSLYSSDEEDGNQH